MSVSGPQKSWFKNIQRNKIFKFTSSVKLAVPLMVILIICVAAGTVIESNFNSDYAKLTVYSSWWFLSLLGLLFLNILNATLSRWPFKKDHVGFVITHIGLLTLLIGSMITAVQGIDGQLQIPEGSSNSWVVLPRLMLSYQFENSPSPQSVIFEKSLSEKNYDSLGFLNDSFGHLFIAEKLLPFARVEKTYSAESHSTSDVGLSFLMKSQFFNVSEWLHSSENPQMQMGPATIRLVLDSSLVPVKKMPSTKVSPRKMTSSPAASPGGKLQVLDSVSKNLLKEISVAQLKKSDLVIQGNKIHFKNEYQRGMVSENKLTESSDPNGPLNPVLELEIVTSKGEKLREILYAKFPGFSLNKNGDGALSFQYSSSAVPAEIQETNENSPHESASAPSADSATGSRVGNTIEFHVHPDQPRVARVELYKNNALVGSEVLAEGQSYQTPWMGMKVTVGTLAWGKKSKQEAISVEPEKGQPLPPSAILLKTPGSDERFWLIEGEAKNIQLKGRSAQIYFGREALELPFSVQLDQFRKVDYPGTETPLSFESEVRINRGPAQIISMNNPLKESGYTLYQASYIESPGQRPQTILSVNKDPGRPLKYWGSLILSLGIAIFTISRSGWYRRISTRKSAS